MANKVIQWLPLITDFVGALVAISGLKPELFASSARTKIAADGGSCAHDLPRRPPRRGCGKSEQYLEGTSGPDVHTIILFGSLRQRLRLRRLRSERSALLSALTSL
jgi:hypothetical protein